MHFFDVVQAIAFAFSRPANKSYITEIVAKVLTYGLKENESNTSNFENGFVDDENIPF